jgi:hypothetical protein
MTDRWNGGMFIGGTAGRRDKRSVILSEAKETMPVMAPFTAFRVTRLSSRRPGGHR